MENQLLRHSYLCLVILVSAFCFPLSAGQTSSSDAHLLFRVRRLLEYPPALAGWNISTNFCYLPPSPSLKIVCSGNRITELTVVGDRGPPTSPSSTTSQSPNPFTISQKSLSSSFSLDSLFTTLSKLSSLESLSLVSLGMWGPLPAKIKRFSYLQVLNLSSNFIYGEIPPQISSLSNLRNLSLDNNLLNGTVPDLTSLQVLEELDLGRNQLGPEFPVLGNKIIALVLRKNAFRSALPTQLEHFNQMRRLDISYNHLVGPIPPRLFSLPSIHYLNLAGNNLTGELPADVSCANPLAFVDLSRNRLLGRLPLCISSNSSTRAVSFSWNCLSSGDPASQHPYSFCNKEVALAAIMPPKQKKASKSNLGLIIGIAGAIVGAMAALVIVVWVILTRIGVKTEERDAANKSTMAAKSPMRVSPNLAPEATIGLPPHRIFTIEEIEEATNDFDPSNFLGKGSEGCELYKGRIGDGSRVLIKCLKLKHKHSIQNLKQHMEMISALRHRHLVSILGHCIVAYQDNPNLSNMIFLVFENISSDTLRSCISERRKGEPLKWPQRLAAVIGVARGIQFLHTRIVPGIFGNNIKMENVLLDENLTAKINNYNLPLPSKDKKVTPGSPFNGAEAENLGSIEDVKEDVYQLGIILLEVITGETITTQSKAESLKIQLHTSLSEAPVKLRATVDPSMRGTFAYESLRTAVQISINCLSSDSDQRPSIEDVLWNLQYSSQVQEGWANSGHLSGNLSGNLSGTLSIHS